MLYHALEGKHTGETNGDKGYFSKVYYTNSSDKILQGLRITLLFLVRKRGDGRPSQREICAPVLRRRDKGRGFFPCLLFLICLPLKIIFMPKLHILGWHILILFICYPHLPMTSYLHKTGVMLWIYSLLVPEF